MDKSLPSAAATWSRLQIWQWLTVFLLFIGYAAYYFCRSDLSVGMPLIIDELHHRGLSQSQAVIRVGAISSWGVLAYAIGKVCLGPIGDVWGGRRSFLVGLGGALVFTLLFASSSAVPLWTVAWAGNRLLQSIGWAGLVKICSKWFSYSIYGTVLGILSLSYLIGDAVARQSMGTLIRSGYGWRMLFYYAAAVAGVVFMANLFFLRESRTELSLGGEPEANPLNLFSSESAPQTASDSPSRGLLFLLRTLFSHRAFWIVCGLSFGCTLIRETFNTWTPTYLRDFLGYTQANAASTSAIFPAVGSVSVIVSGWLSDRLGPHGRALVMIVGLTAAGAGLLALTGIRGGVSGNMPVLLIGLVAFCLLGPYSYLGGAMALDFGGKQAGASSSGIIDGIGYVGGIMAGDTVARVSVRFGWRGVFFFLAAISTLSALAAASLLLPAKSARSSA